MKAKSNIHTSFKAGHGPLRSGVSDVLKVHIARLFLRKMMLFHRLLTQMQIIVVTFLRRPHKCILRLAWDDVGGVVSGGSRYQRITTLTTLQRALAAFLWRHFDTFKSITSEQIIMSIASSDSARTLCVMIYIDCDVYWINGAPHRKRSVSAICSSAPRRRAARLT